MDPDEWVFGVPCPDCGGPMVHFCPLCGDDLLAGGAHGAVSVRYAGGTQRMTLCWACGDALAAGYKPPLVVRGKDARPATGYRARRVRDQPDFN